MNGDPTKVPHEIEIELERGLALASVDDFAAAAELFDHAHKALSSAHPSLRNSLAAFGSSQVQYCRMEHDLHEASKRFAAAVAARQNSLAGIQRFLVSDPDEERVALPIDTPHRTHRAVGIPPHASDAAPLQISCFGRFTVRRGDVPIEACANRNGQMILRYLAAHPHHRETSDALIDVLWPDDPPGRARHKLHCAVSALRRTLNGESAPGSAGYLVCEDGTYALNPAQPIRIDSDDFVTQYEAGRRSEGAEAVTRYEAACRLYVGTFLPDDLYADWSVARRERLSQLLVMMCTVIAEDHARAGRYSQAADWALRILEENRCDEAAYRLLIRARALAGDRAEAIRQYDRCTTVLAAELGVLPLPATAALYDAILRDELHQLAPMPSLEGVTAWGNEAS